MSVAVAPPPAVAAELDAESRRYLAYHSLRYEYLLRYVARAIGARPRPTVLDIGPSFQTARIRQAFPGATVDSLGWESPHAPRRAHERHWAFDLNDAQHESLWPRVDPHDVVVFAEVLEHLYTAPSLVLRCIATWLAPGGVLVLQTPNAAALAKRVLMAVGRNPFEPIRETRDKPGHFREYTLRELVAVARSCGYDVVVAQRHNYFRALHWKRRLYNVACAVMPPSLRDGITMMLRKLD